MSARLHRLGAWLATAALVGSVGTGCGAQDGDDRPTVGEEATEPAGTAGSPPAEEDAPEGAVEGGSGAAPVSLELPGLPIGGSEVTFSQPERLCAEVSWTGGEIPAGAQVTITAFAVSEGFSWDDQPCGALPPCVGGEPFSAEGGQCAVGVTWSGLPAEGVTGQLAATAGRATCDAASACADLVAVIGAAGTQTIDLVALGEAVE
jgi:hypothetical protein